MPSTIPSQHPSNVYETVTIKGYANLNSNVCNLEDLAALSNAIQATIQLIACSNFDDCICETPSVCGNSNQRRLSLRHLQSSGSWQVVYEVTVTILCELATCSSNEDIAAITDVSGIKNIITDSISNGGFAIILNTNLEQETISDELTTLLACLVVWGTTEEPVLEVAAKVYYPDWEHHSGTCLNDGNEPTYMKQTQAWLFDNLEECCNQHFGGWNQNKCMHPGGSGLWYLSHVNGKCVTDCDEGTGITCGGLANLESTDLFTDPMKCCETKLPWVLAEFCEVSR